MARGAEGDPKAIQVNSLPLWLPREYVLGPEPVAFQILSDQGDAFEGRRGQVNYEDPSYSVSLPVFAIHGAVNIECL